MMSVLKSSVAPLAVLVAMGAGLSIATQASAADLGGDCCADLEERIAELEATTARKGNRKVSLTISGWVNEMVMFWDDGDESNVYVGTNSLEQSRFKLSGKAKIDSEWSAGYTLEFGINGNASNGFSQATDDGGAGISMRKSYWYVKSETMGQLAVGLNGTATYHVVDDMNEFSNLRNYSDFEAAAVAVNSFKLRSGGAAVGGGLAWKDALRGFNNATAGQSGRRNVVRYDTPEIAGFSATAAWGEDDMWDVAGRYENKAFGDFGVAVQIGYGESSDFGSNKCDAVATADKCTWWGAGGSIIHNPTGLFVYGGYGQQKLEQPFVAIADSTSSTWLVQGGIIQKWTALGTTTIFGEYRKDNAGSNVSAGTVGADLDFWGAGIVQNIDAAAMDLYLVYRNADGDVTLNGVANPIRLDDFDLVQAGARIQF